jgi:hypothetical protein
MFKKILTGFWLVLLAITIGLLFWYNDLVYSRPTPVPHNYKAVATGTVVKLPGLLCGYNNKPLFLHFFNPDCPCSRFNTRTFKALVKTYRGKVNFAVVVVSKTQPDLQAISENFGGIPAVQDRSISAICGVYSTPQAVLLDGSNKLYYRGNYNRGRYCNDEKTNFAKIAIDQLLQNDVHPAFNPMALRAYGCQLPGCKKD